MPSKKIFTTVFKRPIKNMIVFSVQVKIIFCYSNTWVISKYSQFFVRQLTQLMLAPKMLSCYSQMLAAMLRLPNALPCSPAQQPDAIQWPTMRLVVRTWTYSIPAYIKKIKPARRCRSAAECVIALFAHVTNRITVVVGGDTNNGFAGSNCYWGQTRQTPLFHWSQSSPDMILCIVPQNFKALTIFSFFIANFAFHRM